MRALIQSAFGTLPELTDVPAPVPAEGEVLIRTSAAALNFADLLMLDGSYQDTPRPPFTPGLECAGVVESLGPETEGPPPGTRVAAFSGAGALAEMVALSADQVLPIPDNMPFDVAAGFQIAYGTSHLALASRARLAPDETLVVLGAAGGVGLTAVEVGKTLGARVIAVARGRDRAEVLKDLGVDLIIDGSTSNLTEALRDAGGFDVLYDPVGGEPFRQAMRAARPLARLIPIGFASGEVPQIPANHLLVKNLDVIGLYWGGYLKFRPSALSKSLAELLKWFAEGRLHPKISHRLPLERVNEGFDLLRERKVTGKVVIEI